MVPLLAAHGDDTVGSLISTTGDIYFLRLFWRGARTSSSLYTRLTAGHVTYADPQVWRRPADGKALPCCSVSVAQGGERIEPAF
ncbi:MAG: hypothetical protein RL375_3928 [Pseudomonadota bacterium]